MALPKLVNRTLGSLPLAAWALLGCGTQFDSIDQVDGLRVLAVQKDRPYAQPGDEVTLDILYHDTGKPRGPRDAQGEPRDLPVSVVWLSGCKNPASDLYSECLTQFTTQLKGLTGRDEDEEMDELEPEQLAALLQEAQQQGLGFGTGSRYSFEIPEDIFIGEDAKRRDYGLSYVFFAACAGNVRIVNDRPFPIGCFDAKGRELGARDFVAGYTAVYSYPSYTNSNPEVLGLEVFDGERLSEEQLCIGLDCEAVEPDPERECGPDDPRVKSCEDPDALDASCDTIPMRLLVDPKSVDLDDVLTEREGEPSTEQMWANFHTDRGKFTFDLALVNDVNAGFNEEPDTEYVAPKLPGPAQIWAVVRDNRSGVQWLRTQVCVTK